MHEIKFRYFNEKIRQMIAVRSAYWHERDATGILPISVNDGLATINSSKLMQYTGLKDKNGREIYEGDVCSLLDRSNPEMGKDSYDIFQVMWSTGSWQASFIHNTEFLFDLSEDGKSGKDIEVIGNIYENKDLLS